MQYSSTIHAQRALSGSAYASSLSVCPLLCYRNYLDSALDCFVVTPAGPSAVRLGGQHPQYTHVLRLIQRDLTPFIEFWKTITIVIISCICRFREFDGTMLLQFKKMMQTAPQYFYHCLEDQFRLNVVEVLNFSRALEALLWHSFEMPHFM